MTDDKRLTPRLDRRPATISDKAKEYAAGSKSENTKLAYRSAWRHFTAWCTEQGVDPLPADPSTVIEYLISRTAENKKLSTIEVSRAAISSAHATAGQADPTKHPSTRAVLAGIRRQIGKPPKKKAPATADDLRAIVAGLPDTINGQRDRALILTGFSGAFRRSELVALDVEDLRIADDMKVTLRRSKTDQEGRGLVKTIPAVKTKELDAIAAMRAWLDAAAIKSGPVFRQIDRWGNLRANRLASQSVALILKRAALAAGLEPRQFSGHSLRSGFITAAADAGAAEWEIQEQTGHKDTRVLRGYIQSVGRGAARAVRAAINGRAEKDDE